MRRFVEPAGYKNPTRGGPDRSKRRKFSVEDAVDARGSDRAAPSAIPNDVGLVACDASDILPTFIGEQELNGESSSVCFGLGAARDARECDVSRLKAGALIMGGRRAIEDGASAGEPFAISFNRRSVELNVAPLSGDVPDDRAGFLAA